MTTFDKTPYHSAEGEARGGGPISGVSSGTTGAASQVLDFTSRLTERNRQEGITRKFDTWCLHNRNFVEGKSLKDKVRVSEEGAYFIIPSGEVFLPYNLGPRCPYNKASKKINIECICSILNLFTYSNRSEEGGRYGPMHSFFTDVMQWEVGSQIWISNENDIGEPDTILHRAQGLTRDPAVIGGNIPDGSGNDEEAKIASDNNPKVLWLASNQIAIVGHQCTSANNFEAHTF